ncbi:MAG: BamA/TamA family outer membrane protein [Deltaproteobacteria bacterium]|nr:BamA/TamA family outer membrane protein [Deltaproteobacteria bacterium]
MLLAGLLAGPLAAPAHAAKPDQLKPNRYEVGAVPALGGDTDVGFGFGAVLSLARFQAGYYPFRWRLELQGYLTVKERPEGGVEWPFHDHYLKLDLPGLLSPRLRWTLRVGFSRFVTAGYYGLGNAAPAVSRADAFDPTLQPREYNEALRYHQFDRVFPRALANVRVTLRKELQLFFAGTAAFNDLRLYPGSKLAEDVASGPPAVRGMLFGASRHLTLQGDAGVLWDSRDHDMVPRSGVLHEASLRAGTFEEGRVYGGFNVTLRFFHAFFRDYLTLAARAVFDLLFGQVPVYELARYGGLFPDYGPGGSTSVRGVPGQRYHGKLKLVGNLELRSKWLPFTVLKQRFNVGTVVFADAGRVWADYTERPELDGKGLGLKVGAGGGVRLQWGEAFMIRTDVAWSPDASPIGFYVDIFHIF